MQSCDSAELGTLAGVYLGLASFQWVGVQSLPYLSQILAIPPFPGIADGCRWEYHQLLIWIILEYHQLIFWITLQGCVLKYFQCDLQGCVLKYFQWDLQLMDLTLKKGNSLWFT